MYKLLRYLLFSLSLLFIGPHPQRIARWQYKRVPLQLGGENARGANKEINFIKVYKEREWEKERVGRIIMRPFSIFLSIIYITIYIYVYLFIIIIIIYLTLLLSAMKSQDEILYSGAHRISSSHKCPRGKCYS